MSDAAIAEAPARTVSIDELLDVSIASWNRTIAALEDYQAKYQPEYDSAVLARGKFVACAVSLVRHAQFYDFRHPAYSSEESLAPIPVSGKNRIRIGLDTITSWAVAFVDDVYLDLLLQRKRADWNKRLYDADERFDEQKKAAFIAEPDMLPDLEYKWSDWWRGQKDQNRNPNTAKDIGAYHRLTEAVKNRRDLCLSIPGQKSEVTSLIGFFSDAYDAQISGIQSWEEEMRRITGDQPECPDLPLVTLAYCKFLGHKEMTYSGDPIDGIKPLVIAAEYDDGYPAPKLMDRSLIAHIDAILSEVRERNSSENLQIRNPGLKALDHELNSHIQGWSEEPPALPAAFMRKFLTNAKALLWLRPSR